MNFYDDYRAILIDQKRGEIRQIRWNNKKLKIKIHRNITRYRRDDIGNFMKIKWEKSEKVSSLGSSFRRPCRRRRRSLVIPPNHLLDSRCSRGSCALRPRRRRIAPRGSGRSGSRRTRRSGPRGTRKFRRGERRFVGGDYFKTELFGGEFLGGRRELRELVRETFRVGESRSPAETFREWGWNFFQLKRFLVVIVHSKMF